MARAIILPIHHIKKGCAASKLLLLKMLTQVKNSTKASPNAPCVTDPICVPGIST